MKPVLPCVLRTEKKEGITEKLTKRKKGDRAGVQKKARGRKRERKEGCPANYASHAAVEPSSAVLLCRRRRRQATPIPAPPASQARAT
ncbi:hypothetical protein M0R45_014504 [Rubus argutus]|uniref:Uncharacterized protein n=1 Tax=Rubus argutus TaxID=59490 RepID=A0AAW1XMF8_RUBAR